MKSVLLVDDDPNVRIQLKAMLENDRLNCRVVAEAADGQNGIRILSKYKPDIMITDMEMPGMDGVALIEWARSNLPSLKIIALSAYDDFHYVRKSLKLGAQDYLLKHSLSLERLEQVFREFSTENEEMQANALISDQMKRQKVLYSLFFPEQQDRKTIISNFQQYQIPLEKNYVCCVMRCFESSGRLKPCSSKINHLIDSVVERSLKQLPNALYARADAQKAALWIGYGVNISKEKIIQDVKKLTCRIRENIKLMLNCSVCFAVSNVRNDLEQTAQAYEEAMNRLEHHFFWGDENLLFEDDWITTNSSWQFKEKEKLERSLREKSFNLYRHVLMETFEEIRAKTPLYICIQVGCGEWMQVLSSFFAAQEIDILEGLHLQEAPYAKAFSETSLTEIQGWLEKVGLEVIGHIALSGAEPQPYSEATKFAIRYLHANYMNPISLRETAEAIGFSPNYLSHIFKKDTGVNIVSFLNEYRIGKAIDLLKLNEDKRVLMADIAAKVGFNSYTNFYNMFRKVTGYTPDAFLKTEK